jgi:uncharacterized protein (DUF1697 family)
MPKVVAFLRAINVGGHTVKMDALRALFEAMGFSNVETFIASGNVIFDSSSKSTRALEKKIAQSLHAALGYKVETFIRSTAELAAIAQYKPFDDAELAAPGSGQYIGFMAERLGRESHQKLLSRATAVDEFHVNGRELYWLCRTRVSDSIFSGPLLEKTIGVAATLRNSTTIRKLAAKYA